MWKIPAHEVWALHGFGIVHLGEDCEEVLRVILGDAGHHLGQHLDLICAAVLALSMTEACSDGNKAKYTATATATQLSTQQRQRQHS